MVAESEGQWVEDGDERAVGDAEAGLAEFRGREARGVGFPPVASAGSGHARLGFPHVQFVSHQAGRRLQGSECRHELAHVHCVTKVRSAFPSLRLINKVGLLGPILGAYRLP